MAIIKTYIYNADEATSSQNILNYLQANAVPDYFDSVELDGNCVLCKVGEHELLKIYPNLTQSGGGYQVYTTTGTALWINSNSSYMRHAYAYKCKHGISITFIDTSATAAMLTIAKTKAGVTAIVAPNSLSVSSAAAVSTLCAVGLNSGPPAAMSAKNSITPLTVLAPVPTSGPEEDYVDGVYFLPFCQTRETGLLDVNGTKYLSNGIWCIKDE